MSATLISIIALDTGLDQYKTPVGIGSSNGPFVDHKSILIAGESSMEINGGDIMAAFVW